MIPLCNLMRIIIISFQFSRNPRIFASDIDALSFAPIQVGFAASCAARSVFF
jgi:hypothetical protein